MRIQVWYGIFGTPANSIAQFLDGQHEPRVNLRGQLEVDIHVWLPIDAEHASTALAPRVGADNTE